jgi:hypothetical protein
MVSGRFDNDLGHFQGQPAGARRHKINIPELNGKNVGAGLRGFLRGQGALSVLSEN